jgi:hypothetical protein
MDDQSAAALGRRLVAVEVADCPSCLSAGSVRRGVCDICGARPVDARPRPFHSLLPIPPSLPTDQAIPA